MTVKDGKTIQGQRPRADQELNSTRRKRKPQQDERDLGRIVVSPEFLAGIPIRNELKEIANEFSQELSGKTVSRIVDTEGEHERIEISDRRDVEIFSLFKVGKPEPVISN